MTDQCSNVFSKSGRHYRSRFTEAMLQVNTVYPGNHRVWRCLSWNRSEFASSRTTNTLSFQRVQIILCALTFFILLTIHFHSHYPQHTTPKLQSVRTTTFTSQHSLTTFTHKTKSQHQLSLPTSLPTHNTKQQHKLKHMTDA